MCGVRWLGGWLIILFRSPSLVNDADLTPVDISLDIDEVYVSMLMLLCEIFRGYWILRIHRC